MNKYAYDVIKVQVTDHFNDLDDEMDGDYDKLKGDFLSIIKKGSRTIKPVSKMTSNNLYEAKLPPQISRGDDEATLMEQISE